MNLFLQYLDGTPNVCLRSGPYGSVNIDAKCFLLSRAVEQCYISIFAQISPSGLAQCRHCCKNETCHACTGILQKTGKVTL